MSWKHTTVAIGTCSVLNSVGVTESRCDAFGGTWTDSGNELNILTQDDTETFSSSASFTAATSAVTKIGGTQTISGTPASGLLTINIVKNSETIDAENITIFSSDSTSDIATRIRNELLYSNFITGIVVTGSGLVVTYDATAGDAKLTITAGTTGLSLSSEGTVATDFVAASNGDDRELRLFSGAVYRRLTPTSASKIGLGLDFLAIGIGFQQVQVSNLPNIRGLLTRATSQKWDGSSWSATGSNTPEVGKPVVDATGGLVSINNATTVTQALTDLKRALERCGVLNPASFEKYFYVVSNEQLQVFSNDDADISDYTLTTVTGGWIVTLSDQAPTYAPVDSGNPDVNPFWETTTKSATNDDLGEEEDTDYSALTGVTHTLIGPTHVYTLSDNTVRIVKGRVRVDTRYNIMVEEYGAPSTLAPSATESQNGSDYRIGIKITDDNYTGGVGLIVAGTQNYGGGGHTSKPIGHQLSIAGAVHIDADIIGPFNYSMVSTGSINNSSPASIIVNDSTLNNPISSKITGGVFNTLGLEQLGGATVINNVGGKATLSGDRKNCVVALQNESSIGLSATVPGTTEANATYITYKDSDFDNNVVDAGAYTVDFTSPVAGSANGTRMQNIGKGSEFNYNGSIALGGGNPSRNSNVYALGTQEITTDFQDTSGNSISGTLLIDDTNRDSDLEVTVVGGTNKTSLAAFDDDEVFTYRGDITSGAISNWAASGGFAAGVLVNTRGDHEIVLWTYSSTTVDGVNRLRADNNTGIWKRSIRGKTSDITSADLDVFEKVYFWSYGFGVTTLAEKIAGTTAYEYKRFLPAVAEATITKANAVILEASSKGDALTYTASQINLTAELTLGELLAIITLRKETDTTDEDLPSRGAKIINGDGTRLNLESLTNNFTGSGKLKIGDGYTEVTHNTALDASDYVQSSDLVLIQASITNLPSTIKGTLRTGGGANTSTGGKTFESTSEMDGLAGGWTFSTAGNTFDGVWNTALAITGTGNNIFNGIFNRGISAAAGNSTFGAAFVQEGTLTLAAGVATFAETSDVSKIDLVGPTFSGAITVVGKLLTEFKSVTGNIFAFVYHTRVDVNLSALGTGIPYSIYNGTTKVATGLTTGVNLKFSSGSNDGGRIQISSIAGDWSLAIADSAKRCTFNAQTITAISSSALEHLQYTMLLPPFDPVFTVSSATVGSRVCTVKPFSTATGKAEFEISGCSGNGYADEAMTSTLFATARKSINYVEAMRGLVVALSIPIPTDGSSITYDACRPVEKGVDLRNGTYILLDTEAGAQLLDGIRNVLDQADFSVGTKTERELRDLATNLETDGVTHKVRTTSRLVVSAAEIGSVTVEELKPPLNSIAIGINKVSIRAPSGIPPIT